MRSPAYAPMGRPHDVQWSLMERRDQMRLPTRPGSVRRLRGPAARPIARDGPSEAKAIAVVGDAFITEGLLEIPQVVSRRPSPQRM